MERMRWAFKSIETLYWTGITMDLKKKNLLDSSLVICLMFDLDQLFNLFLVYVFSLLKGKIST